MTFIARKTMDKLSDRSDLLIKWIIFFLLLMTFTAQSESVEVPLSLFPMEHYSQKTANWINPNASSYNKPIISTTTQQQRAQDYYNHLFASIGATTSPWNPSYISRLFAQYPDIQTLEKQVLETFDNAGKPPQRLGYGENFRLHTQQWIDAIKKNMQLNTLSHLSYQEAHRGITTTNLHARLLPTNDVHFYAFNQPGQGYPFDNLQMSSVWAGTPVYRIARSQDGAWDYVVTPAFIAWVPSHGIAYTSDSFISQWQHAAQRRMLAITQTKAPIISQGIFRFSGYIGAVFPAGPQNNTMMIPVQNTQGSATIQYATLPQKYSTEVPLSATAHHFADIIEQMKNRPYGWGGLYFYNDCSAETKSLYTPFGIWLPRHSSAQQQAGKVVDQSTASLNERLTYLLQNGHPMMTLITIDGHVMLYIGTDVNHSIAMTYQNIWGLSPSDRSRRAVIGESVFLPLLKSYPEDPSLASLAGKAHFQLVYLDQWSPTYNNSQYIDLKALILP